MSERLSFAEEINANKYAETVSSDVINLATIASSVDVRIRGGFVTDCELTSPTTGNRVDVLFAESDLTKPKLSASHAMVPAGPYDGIGGQHGFPRWSDYHEFPVADGTDGKKVAAIQAKRSDQGFSLIKDLELTDSALTMRTTVRSSDVEPEQTSIGEHLYFALEDERFDGLQLNGQTLDELLGDGSEDTLQNAGTLYWEFGGESVISFPAGHSVRLSATFEGNTKYPLAMWIWKRQGSPSICFEPVVGVSYFDQDDTSGVEVPPYGKASLSTKIELL
jgi:hypothetical protein